MSSNKKTARIQIVLHVYTLADAQPSQEKKQKIETPSKSSENSCAKSPPKLQNEKAAVKVEPVQTKKLSSSFEKQFDLSIEMVFSGLKRAFDNQRSAQIIARTLATEKTLKRADNAAAWESICKSIFSKCVNAKLIKNKEISLGPKGFYQEALKAFVSKLFLSHIKILHEKGIFNVYKPDEKPFILFACQKNLNTDIWPSVEVYIPLADMVSYGLIFEDISTYNPLVEVDGFENAKPICYGVFHSFGIEFNLAAAFFKSQKNDDWGFRWAIYDRHSDGYGNVSDGIAE